MGSTVTTNKQVGAFATAVGKIAYVLFEQTYEKNCYPHTPSWSCRFIGFLDEAIAYIFSSAGGCEGGMLQNRNGYITPEGYIDGWMAKMASPRYMENFLIEIGDFGSWRSPLPASQREYVFEKLRQHNRSDLVEVLQAGKSINLRLHEDFALLASIYGGYLLAPWRIIKDSKVHAVGAEVPGLGYAPKPAKTVELDEPKTLSVDGDNCLIQQPDGTWRCVGWRYVAVDRYITQLAQQALAEPFAYRKKIKAYRKALHTAPRIPDGGKIVVDWSKPLGNKYDQERINSFPHSHNVAIRDTGYEADVVKDDRFLWDACALPAECTQWVFPDAAPLQVAQQMDLLVA